MDDNDRILIQRLVQQGDPDAFSAIMAEYAGLVYNTGRRVLGDDAQAADVVQETFFHFLKNAHRITGSLGSWLHLVATRRAVDLIRRDSSRRRREMTYANDASRPPGSWAEIEPLVDEALAELPDELRDVLVLHYIRGHSMSRIAAAKGLSQPTISRRVAAALDTLRQNLRARDVTVGLAALGTFLTESAQAVPLSLVDSLGKMALAKAASSSLMTARLTAASVFSTGSKVAFGAAVLVLLAGATSMLLYRRMSPAGPGGPLPAAVAVATNEVNHARRAAPPPAISKPDIAAPVTFSNAPPNGFVSVGANPMGFPPGARFPQDFQGQANASQGVIGGRGTFPSPRWTNAASPGFGPQGFQGWGANASGGAGAGRMSFGGGASGGGGVQFGNSSGNSFGPGFATNYSYSHTWTYTNGRLSETQQVFSSGGPASLPQRR